MAWRHVVLLLLLRGVNKTQKSYVSNCFFFFIYLFVSLCFVFFFFFANKKNNTNIVEIGTFRGGCIMCMDYGRYAAESYVRLVRVFDPIAQILTMQLHLLDYMGFDMNNGYLFGFSYGGQLATEAGRRIGHKRLKEIDSKSIECSQAYFAFLLYKFTHIFKKKTF